MPVAPPSNSGGATRLLLQVAAPTPAAAAAVESASDVFFWCVPLQMSCSPFGSRRRAGARAAGWLPERRVGVLVHPDARAPAPVNTEAASPGRRGALLATGGCLPQFLVVLPSRTWNASRRRRDRRVRRRDVAAGSAAAAAAPAGLRGRRAREQERGNEEEEDEGTRDSPPCRRVCPLLPHPPSLLPPRRALAATDAARHPRTGTDAKTTSEGLLAGHCMVGGAFVLSLVSSKKFGGAKDGVLNGGAKYGVVLACVTNGRGVRLVSREKSVLCVVCCVLCVVWCALCLAGQKGKMVTEQKESRQPPPTATADSLKSINSPMPGSAIVATNPRARGPRSDAPARRSGRTARQFDRRTRARAV